VDEGVRFTLIVGAVPLKLILPGLKTPEIVPVPVTEILTDVPSPAHTFSEPVSDEVGRELVVTEIERDAPDPQPLMAVAVTVKSPDVAAEEKSTVTLLPLPFIVAPVPL
jgi:hypothetical protein